MHGNHPLSTRNPRPPAQPETDQRTISSTSSNSLRWHRCAKSQSWCPCQRSCSTPPQVRTSSASQPASESHALSTHSLPQPSTHAGARTLVQIAAVAQRPPVLALEVRRLLDAVGDLRELRLRARAGDLPLALEPLELRQPPARVRRLWSHPRWFVTDCSCRKRRKRRKCRKWLEVSRSLLSAP